MKFFRFSITLVAVLLVAGFLVFSVGRFKSLASTKPEDVSKENTAAYDEFELGRKMVSQLGDTYLATAELVLEDNQPVDNLPYALSQSLGNVFSYVDPTTNPNSLDETVYGQIQMYTTGFYKKNKTEEFKGADAVLTLRSDYQSRLFELLDGTAGQAVLLNYQNGDILASVSQSKNYSLYDCVNQENYTFDEEGNVVYTYDSCNSVTNCLVYPGSTIKPLLALSILNTQEGASLLDHTYQCNPGVVILEEEHQYAMQCYGAVGHQHIGLKQAISQSCNKFLLNYCYSNNISKAEVISNMESFGLGGSNDGHLTSFFMRTGVYCLDEDYSFYMSGIGEGDCKLPLLAIATAYSGIANGGVVAKPRYVKAYMEDGEMTELEVEEQRITSEENANMISEMMRDTTVNGTARKLAYMNDSLQLSCKTGSAEYGNGNTHKLLISFSNNPNYPYLLAVDISQMQGQALDVSGAFWEYVLLGNN